MSETIRDIVRRGQEALALGKNYWVRAAHGSWLPRGIQYPKSLGELCLEIAQDDILENSKNDYLAYVGKTVGFDWPIRGDIQQLKQAMWHKHTDYTQEVAQKWWEESVKIAEKRGKK